MLTCLRVDGPGKLSLRGIRLLHERVVARPAVDYTRAQMLVLGRKLHYRTVRVHSFTSHCELWAPILKAHHGRRGHQGHRGRRGHPGHRGQGRYGHGHHGHGGSGHRHAHGYGGRGRP